MASLAESLLATDTYLNPSNLLDLGSGHLPKHLFQFLTTTNYPKSTTLTNANASTKLVPVSTSKVKIDPLGPLLGPTKKSFTVPRHPTTAVAIGSKIPSVRNADNKSPLPEQEKETLTTRVFADSSIGTLARDRLLISSNRGLWVERKLLVALLLLRGLPLLGYFREFAHTFPMYLFLMIRLAYLGFGLRGFGMHPSIVVNSFKFFYAHESLTGIFG